MLKTIEVTITAVPPSPSKVEVQALVRAGGATLLSREPDPEAIPPSEQGVPHHAPAASPLAATSHLILYEEGARKGPGCRYNMAHLKTLPVAWLLAALASQQLVDPPTPT